MNWHSIRFKLVSTGVALVLVISGSIFWLVSSAEEALVRSTFQSETASLCELIAQNIRVAISHDDFSALPRSAEWLRDYSDLEQVIITDVEGNPLVHIRSPDGVASRDSLQEGPFGAGLIVHVSQIPGFGEIKIARSLSRLEAAMAGVKRRALGISMLLAALGIGGVWWLSTQIVTPLRGLTQATDNLAEGAYHKVVVPHSRDEVALLASRFNWMIEQVERRTEEMEQLNRSLAAEITERERAETALRESEAQRRMVISNAPIILFALDTSGAITLAEGKALGTLGLDPGRLVGRKAWEVFPLDHKIRDDTERALAGEVLSSEMGINTMTFDVSYLPCLGDRDQVTGVIGLAVDITERKRAEREAEALQNRLLESQKMEAIGSLAGGIAHDFNNLLVGVMGHASILLQRPPSSGQLQRSGEAILTAAQRASALTQQLLGFARKGTFQRTGVDINDAVEETSRLLSHSIPKTITIRADLKARRSTFLADPNQVQQVIINLALNARDAMQHGGELFFRTTDVVCSPPHCEHPPELVHGNYLALSVSDTGEGIPPDVFPHIFEPFYSTKPAGQGSGMGLAMVYGIVSSQGGVIQAESHPGKGSVFKIYIPCCDEPVSNPRVRGQEPPAVLTGGTVLVIDDEAVVRDLVLDLLEMLGLSTLAAESGSMGLELYEKHRDEIDLVILDMLMPGMDGKECFGRLRSMDPEIKVLMSSGFTAENSIQPLLDMGAIGFLKKPYGIAQFSETIRGAMGQAGTQAA